jgi:DNA-binding transcriptional MerR regulator
MDRLDLEKPQFSQSDVLTLAPEIKAKMLQNWNDRGLLNTKNQLPGRQGKRLYSGVGVVMLRFMGAMTNLGIQPSDAREMADRIGDHAVGLHGVYPTSDDRGIPEWVIAGSHPEFYHRAYIIKDGSKYLAIIMKEELGIMRTLLPHTYITVEIDFLVLQTLNRIYEFCARRDGIPFEPFVSSDDDLSRSHRILMQRLSAPGSNLSKKDKE